MVLDAERGNGTVLEAFHRVVVQIEVRDFHFVQIEAFRVHGETVILRRNLHLVPFDVQDRMIPAVVSEFQLVCPAA